MARAVALNPGLPASVTSFSSLLLFAHVGVRFWRQMPAQRGKNPVDEYALRLVTEWLERTDIDDYRILYPSDDCSLDLRELGRSLGWHHDSPLGIGIHPDYGTWFAYRVAVAVNIATPSRSVETSGSPCHTCLDKPCVQACPADAVSAVRPFDLKACAAFRLQPDSPCARRCLARDACPVAVEHSYDEDQLDYHYTHSLQSLKAFSD